eukprot:138283_1
MTVVDQASFAAECTATVKVVDETAPTAACRTGTYVLGSTGTATVASDDVDDGSSDNCPLDYEVSPVMVDCDDVTTPPTVTLTVEDPSDNTDQCTVEVEVVDETNPTAYCKPATYTLSTESPATATVLTEDIDDGSNDNCPLDYEVSPGTVGCDEVSSPPTVTLNVEDPAANTAECTTEVMVVDDTPPTPKCKVPTISLSDTVDAGTATVTTEDIDDGSTDNCEVEGFSISDTLVDCDDVSTSPTVTLTVEDPSANTAECTTTVKVVDETNPTAKCQATTYSLSSEGTATVQTADIEDGSTDNCPLEFSVSPGTVGCVDVSEATITLTAEDPSFNTDACTVAVGVVDDMDPTAKCKGTSAEPLSISLSSGADTGTATVNTADIDDGSVDNPLPCPLTYSVSPSTVGCSDLGTNTITLTVEDPSDNTDQCTTVVQVVDDVNPTATCKSATY